MPSLVDAQSPIGPLHLRVPPRLPADTTLAEAARCLREEEVSLALVGEHPPRVVTERDLVAGLALGLGPASRIAEVASADLVRAGTGTLLGVATSRMLDHGIRHLIVVDDTGEVVGVLSLREAARMLLHSIGSQSGAADAS